MTPVREALEPQYQQFSRTAIAEMTPWVEGFDMSRVSVSAPDKEAGSPKPGDMIARNPKNHDERWLVAAAYFADNFAPVSAAPGEPCAVKPLEWEIHATDGSSHSSETILGRYVTWESVSGYWMSPEDKAGRPVSGGLNAAKAAAQADYEQRIRSALVTTPQPAAGWNEAIEVCIRELEYCRDHGHEPDITTIKKLKALRREAPAPAEGVRSLTPDEQDGINKALLASGTVVDARPDTAEARLREALKSAQRIIERDFPNGQLAKDIREALSPPSSGDEAKESTQPDATPAGSVVDNRSGVTGGESAANPSDPPADRREIVARPRVIDNDCDEVTVTLDGKELRGWSYTNDQERRTKMLCAREFVEGFCTGREV